MDSRKFGSAVLATVSIDDENMWVYTQVASALNKQNITRATAMRGLLEQALCILESVVEQSRPKTLAECYEAFPASLKAKLTLQNGRFYFAVVGTALEAEKWGERLEAGGHTFSKYGADVLSKPDYDEKHRLEAGKLYKLGLVLGTEIVEDHNRSTVALQNLGRREVGEQAVTGLKAELALLIREKFSNAELEAMGLGYIAVLHEPIVDSGGYPCVLYSLRRDGSRVHALYAPPGSQWRDNGAFACLAS